MKLLLRLLPLFLIIGCSQPEVPISIKNGVDSISAKWAPDKREAIADVVLAIDSTGRFNLKGETDLPGLKNEIMEYLEDQKVEYTDNLIVLPDLSKITKPWGLITISVASMKREPSFSSEMVSQAIMGTPVKILKNRGSWSLVQTPDYYIGWIIDSSIQELDEAEFESWKNSVRYIYMYRSGDIFPGKDSNTLVSDIVNGSIVVDSGGGKEGIARVALPDGRSGWIAKDVIMDFDKWCSTVKPDPQKMITFARSLVGYPYMWGGTSTKAIDCSGFTRIIYFTGGIILARDASQQFKHGIYVDISKSLDYLEPGDLLYFGYVNREGIERITHTGMYIGNTEVIHSSGMVRINSLDSTRANYSSYLGKGLRGARRIIGTESARGNEKVALHNWYRDIK
jgi:gamma-D-glutamyl-L-lysine dipeptidyl-peptidase